MFGLVLAIGLWPLLALLATSIAIIAFLDPEYNEYGSDGGSGGATVAAVIGAAVLFALTKWNPIPWIQAHVLLFGGLVLGYFVVGVVWGFFKWYLFLLKRRDAGAHTAPNLAQNKGRIVSWMTYWPWSMTWFAINDPIRHAWRFVWSKTAATYQRISDKVFPPSRVAPLPTPEPDDNW